MSDILIASQKEVARLLGAFRQITSMQARLKIVELAERFARDNPANGKNLNGLSHAVLTEDHKVLALRHRQSFDDKTNCA